MCTTWRCQTAPGSIRWAAAGSRSCTLSWHSHPINKSGPLPRSRGTVTRHSFPLEAEEGGGSLRRFYMVVGGRNVSSTAELAVLEQLEQLAILAFQGLHLARVLMQVPVHMAGHWRPSQMKRTPLPVEGCLDAIPGDGPQGAGSDAGRYRASDEESRLKAERWLSRKIGLSSPKEWSQSIQNSPAMTNRVRAHTRPI